MSRKTIAMLASAVLGLAAAPALYAHALSDSEDAPSSMMGGHGMMSMMEQCSQMMEGMMGGQGGSRPNEQWEQRQSATPERG